ncbi:PadR family transcriptional regulator [Micromonospora sp. NPDC048170]|uniref:PadR family transcriptional regulator n=1 Tax=Micromonospora sp. NPDC048170 TaxID=3154819 RepID=UPI00341030C6
MMILGLVRGMQPVHGYDVRRELLGRGADRWANVQPGSIYHALRKLTREGLLREVATEQVGARPPRTTYEVTPEGEEAFESLLRDLWWQLHEPPDPFVAAFSFLPAMPPEEAAAALRNRANLLRAGVEWTRTSLSPGWAREAGPVHVGWMSELWAARSEAEISWCEQIAERIESGVSYLPDGTERAQGGEGRSERLPPADPDGK